MFFDDNGDDDDDDDDDDGVIQQVIFIFVVACIICYVCAYTNLQSHHEKRIIHIRFYVSFFKEENGRDSKCNGLGNSYTLNSYFWRHCIYAY